MTKNKGALLMAVVGILAFGIGAATGISIAGKTAVSPIGGKSDTQLIPSEVVTLPETALDATSSIPDTSVSVSYPKNGFYGLGTKIVTEPAASNDGYRSLGAITILPGTDPNADRLVSLTVSAHGLKAGETLESAIASGKIAEVPMDPAKQDGTFVTINGHKVFVHKVLGSPTHSAWQAVSFGKKEIVMTTLEFMPGTDASSYTAFRNDDQLFFQILSNLKFS